MVETRSQTTQAATWQLETARLQSEINGMEARLETKLDDKLQDMREKLMADFSKLLETSWGKKKSSDDEHLQTEGDSVSGVTTSCNLGVLGPIPSTHEKIHTDSTMGDLPVRAKQTMAMNVDDRTQQRGGMAVEVRAILRSRSGARTCKGSTGDAPFGRQSASMASVLG
ncbi:hypothetical protein V6N11_030351 [Hibiscus sabdariffa]|uniref:Uncharacterized protein n=1 Tax=Hibiscus sabdariffa TaxID=183260 RepID=A0ABR2PLC6_9ROSI